MDKANAEQSGARDEQSHYVKVPVMIRFLCKKKLKADFYCKISAVYKKKWVKIVFFGGDLRLDLRWWDKHSWRKAVVMCGLGQLIERNF